MDPIAALVNVTVAVTAGLILRAIDASGIFSKKGEARIRDITEPERRHQAALG